MATELITALDVSSEAEAFRLVESIGPAVTWYKVGKQLFTRLGPSIVQGLKARGKKVFLDMKFHDIPLEKFKKRMAAKKASAAGTDAPVDEGASAD